MVVDSDTLGKIVKVPYPISSAQRKAVLSPEPYLRIVASAGTGKTETITRRIVYLLAQGETPKSIVAFTFTDRAAQDMKERIYRRVESILGSESTKHIGEMYIGTIHGFAMRLLQDRFGYGNYDVLDENQEMAFVLRHGWSLGLAPKSKLALTSNYSENCKLFIGSVNVVYDELIDILELSKETPVFSDEFQKYEGILDKNKLLTFGRIIRLAVEKIESNPQVLLGYKHLVVDEYQDINRSQERLITIFAQSASCYVVGDPRQCIYQWRGSDPGCFERFSSKFNAATVDIVENRRSAKSIVKVGNGVGNKLDEQALRAPMTPVRSEEGTTVLIEHDTNTDEARWVAKQIKQMLEKDSCNYQDIAILLRSVSTSGPEIIDELKREGIPYLVGGRVGLFKRDEAQALGRIFTWCGDMQWQEDPYNWRSRIQDEELLTSAVTRWPNKVSKPTLRSFKKKILSGGFQNFTEAYQELLVKLSFLTWDPSNPQDAAMMANLGKFNTLLTDFESSKRRGGAKSDLTKDLRDLAWFLNTYASGAYEEQPAEDLQGRPAVQVVTVHQAKGLEWPIVFVPALTAERFPSKNAGKTRQWFVSDSLFERKRYEGGLDDETKLFYVAVTRARDGLSLSYFSRINRQTSPSSLVSGLGLERQSPQEPPFATTIKSKGADEDEIATYSATEIVEYLRCPYFYRLRNVWGYQAGLAELIGYGKSLHQVLRVLSEKAMAGEDPLETLDDALSADFHLPYARPGISKVRQNSARNDLEAWINNHVEDMKATEEVEARLEFQLTKKATVSGRVDVILGQKGERELRDYKTANDPEDENRTLDEASLQLHIYALGLKEIGQDVTRASVAHITEKQKSKQLSQVALDGISLEKARKKAAEAISGILAGQFDGIPCVFCKDCDYNAICRFRSA